MASQVIITDLFRASHVHLKEKKSFQQGDTPKYRVAAMWPKTGIGQIAKIGVQFNSPPNIFKLLCFLIPLLVLLLFYLVEQNLALFGGRVTDRFYLIYCAE